MPRRRNVSTPENVGPVRPHTAPSDGAIESQESVVTVGRAKTGILPAYMSQVQAAAYLGVSTRYFRDHVDVDPVPFPGGGDRPLERYARVDLDAWAERWRSPKSRRVG
jgi:hypothetical protein